MTTIATRRYLSSAWLLEPREMKSALSAGAERIASAKKRLEARWEARAREAIALRQLECLSDRELHDIAIDRSDIPRAARETNFVR